MPYLDNLCQIPIDESGNTPLGQSLLHKVGSRNIGKLALLGRRNTLYHNSSSVSNEINTEGRKAYRNLVRVDNRLNLGNIVGSYGLHRSGGYEEAGRKAFRQGDAEGAKQSLYDRIHGIIKK